MSHCGYFRAPLPWRGIDIPTENVLLRLVKQRFVLAGVRLFICVLVVNHQ